MTTVPRIVIAGTHSGAGKTSVSLGLMAALRASGLVVQPYKVGPDYLDPGYHALACGRQSWSLDSWMLGTEGVTRSFLRGAQGADITVIEGMMGLFDGASATDDSGSTAEVSRLLDAPVILVIDAAGVARSAGAVVQGYRDFNPAVNLAGVIANRVAGEAHFRLIRPAIEALGLPLLGWLPQEEHLTLPERHLGLVSAGENEGAAAAIDRLRHAVSHHVDVDRLRAIAGTAPSIIAPEEPHPAATPGTPVRIGAARDEAFCFYYPENLAILESLGAEIVPFSPLKDHDLPAGVHGVYLAGGYPELHAETIAANRPMLTALRRSARTGMPLFAECGGFMVLCTELETIDGAIHAMAGVVPGRVIMETRLQAIGYREVSFSRDTPLGLTGMIARGHEYRYSRHEGVIPIDNTAFLIGGWMAGYATDSVLASYLHLHFGSNPDLAAHFVERSRLWAAARRRSSRRRIRGESRASQNGSRA